MDKIGGYFSDLKWTIFIFGIILSLLINHFYDDIPARFWVLVIAIGLATLGWIVTTNIALRNSIKQHTFNVLLQSRLSNTFKKYRENFSKKYPEYPTLVCVPQKDVDDLLSGTANEETKRALEGLKYLINYYEFIAAGIDSGDLDEELLKKCLRSIIVDVCVRGDLYIKMIRKEKEGIAEFPKYYEHLLRLKSRWE